MGKSFEIAVRSFSNVGGSLPNWFASGGEGWCFIKGWKNWLDTGLIMKDDLSFPLFSFLLNVRNTLERIRGGPQTLS